MSEELSQKVTISLAVVTRKDLSPADRERLGGFLREAKKRMV